MSDTAWHNAMQRAIELATRGPARGQNPRVGCVLLDEHGRTIGEGWHRGAGTVHAEVAALADAVQHFGADAPRGATAVVTLEPCNHYGRTGPCSEALIAAGVARVVFGVLDPGIRSRGGAERLRAAGCEVVEGVLAQECEELISDWLVATRLGRPYVVLKWAASLDGRVAAADGSSMWITGAAARQRVHEERAAADAIIIGTGTLLADDPSLTARGDAGELLADQPTPVIIGEREIPPTAAVRRHPRALLHEPTHDLPNVLDQLYHAGARRVFVEGGPTLASAFLAADLVDELSVYMAPTLLGGPRAAVGDIGVDTLADARAFTLHTVEQLGTDVHVRAVRTAMTTSTGSLPRFLSTTSPEHRLPEHALAEPVVPEHARAEPVLPKSSLPERSA